MKQCPKCSSTKIKHYIYLGAKIIKCGSCGFDESKIYEVYPQQKTSQKAKMKYNVYKSGGSARIRKK